MIKLSIMKGLIVLIITVITVTGCKQSNKVIELKGYIVYKLPNYLMFIETKGKTDSDYINHFAKDNFLQGIWFKPNCEIEKTIGKIKADSLLNEDPEIKEYSIFLRDPLVFPAEIMLVDTCSNKEKSEPDYKFKMVYKGNPVEFNYKEFKGIVIDIKRMP